jgi:hypothetical protein
MKTLLLSLIAAPCLLHAVSFEAWIATYGLTGADALENADPDRDRLTNLVEYALHGLNPTTPNSSAAITTFGFAPASQDGSYGQAEASPPHGAPRAWHHAMTYRLRGDIEGISVYPQISHDCPATRSGGSMLYWLGEGGRADALIMVYTRADGSLQAMSRARGHIQTRCFMRLQIVRDGGLKMPVTEGAVTAFLGLTTGPLQYVARTVGSQVTTNVTDRDTTYQQIVRPAVVYDIRWPWSVGNSGLTTGDVTRTSSPPGLLTLSGTDLWQYAASGSATISLVTPTRTYTQAVNAFTIGEQTTRTLTTAVSGSLRAHLVAQIDTRAAGYGSINERAQLYSARDPGVSYTRNANSWLTGVDMTPVSTWNSETAAYGNTWRGQTLISPRHYIGAAHWAVSTGTVLHFVTSANAVVSRTVTGRQIIAGTDIIVGVLDSDVPGTIAFARVLPDAWAPKLPTLSLFPYPVVSLNQGQEASIRELASLASSYVVCQAPQLASRQSFYDAAISGDSGSPCFFIVNNAMVLLTTWYSGGGGAGPFITAYRTQINAAMAALGGGYTLTDVNLSGFTTF